jgi:zinc finger-containing ubiquitin peptidase 1
VSLRHLGLIIFRCEANAFTRYGELLPHETLLLAVGEYFSGDDFVRSEEKVCMTDKPPIYFQHQGHSMTIVGLEARTSGNVNLVVFDPMFNPSPAIKKLVGSNSLKISNPERMLKAHRRNESYLSRYKEFEVLK